MLGKNNHITSLVRLTCYSDVLMSVMRVPYSFLRPEQKALLQCYDTFSMNEDTTRYTEQDQHLKECSYKSSNMALKIISFNKLTLFTMKKMSRTVYLDALKCISGSQMIPTPPSLLGRKVHVKSRCIDLMEWLGVTR